MIIAFLGVLITVSFNWFSDNDFMIKVPSIVYGFFILGYIPTCLSYGAELTFPLQPALVNGTLFIFGDIFTFLFTLFGTLMTNKGPNDNTLEEGELIIVRQ